MAAMAMVEDLVVLEDGSLDLCPDAINRSNRHTLLLKMFSSTLRYNSQETDSFPDDTEIEMALPLLKQIEIMTS